MPDEKKKEDADNLTGTGIPMKCSALSGPPKYEPEKWDEATNFYNNCYNYATNLATGKASHPGQWKGDDGHQYEKPAEAMTLDYLKKGCELDGLKYFNPADSGLTLTCPKSCHLVALYILPHVVDQNGKSTQKGDFHFARQDSDGTWSHKQGPFKPEKIKKNGQPITKPEDYSQRDMPGNARRRPYQFKGTFCVCKCQVDIEKEGDKTRWQQRQQAGSNN